MSCQLLTKESAGMYWAPTVQTWRPSGLCNKSADPMIGVWEIISGVGPDPGGEFDRGGLAWLGAWAAALGLRPGGLWPGGGGGSPTRQKNGVPPRTTWGGPSNQNGDKWRNASGKKSAPKGKGKGDASSKGWTSQNAKTPHLPAKGKGKGNGKQVAKGAKGGKGKGKGGTDGGKSGGFSGR